MLTYQASLFITELKACRIPRELILHFSILQLGCYSYSFVNREGAQLVNGY